MEEKVLAILFEACDDRVIYTDENVDLFETGLLDSMGFIELLITLEEEFDIEISPTEIRKDELNTPRRLIAFLKSKL